MYIYIYTVLLEEAGLCASARHCPFWFAFAAKLISRHEMLPGRAIWPGLESRFIESHETGPVTDFPQKKQFTVHVKI